MVKFERIDGKLYAWGSPEHKQAVDNAIAMRVQMLKGTELGQRLDSAQTAFLARDLVYLQSDMQKVLYAKLQMAQFVQIKSEVPRGAEQWAYRQIDIRGEARVGAHLHSDDAPTADVGIEEFLNPVSHVTASYEYTLDELEKAAFARVPLQRDKAEACAEIIARGIDKFLRVGNDGLGVTGFLNNPSVPVHAVTTGAWLGGTTTPAQVIADVRGAEDKIITQSKDNHMGTRLVLPTAYEGHLVTTTLGDSSDTNLKKWLIANSRGIREIERYIALDSASGPSGVTDPPFGVLYDPNPANVYAEVPVPYEELPPQARNYAWVVPARAIVGGLVWKRPLSAVYVEALD